MDGGFHERLVGLTKRALQNLNCLTERQLVTILTKVEAVVNTRTLVYIDDDINSSATLTPMNFLSLYYSHDLTEDSDPEYDVTKKGSAEQLLQTWKCGQKHLNQFWTM